MSNLERPDPPVDPGWCRLLSVRESFTEPQVFVCTICRYSEQSLMQIRCPNCQRLMVRVKQ